MKKELKEHNLNIPDDFLKYYEPGINTIVKIPSEILTKPCKDVTFVTLQVRQVINQMIKAMKETKGLGLAAPQIGINQNIIVIDGPKPMEFINPKVIEYSGSYIEIEEGCLSIPGLYAQVSRKDKVVVSWMDKNSKKYTAKFDGLISRVIQHEIDHLKGILFIDLIDNPNNLNWKHIE